MVNDRIGERCQQWMQLTLVGANLRQGEGELSRSAGLPEEEVQAVVEAESLAAALNARRMGRAPHSPAFPLDLRGGTGVSSEAAVLVHVARHFRTSPIVDAIVREVKQGDAIPRFLNLRQQPADDDSSTASGPTDH